MKIALFIVANFISILAFSRPDYEAASRLMYSNIEEQVFIEKYFKVVELHKSNDPFFGRVGPSIAGYSLDEERVAFMANISEKTVDLILFNWDLEKFVGLEKHAELSRLLEENVFILRNIDKKSISSQGEKSAELANFSYILGSGSRRAQLIASGADVSQLPDTIQGWSPHPEFMSTYHPFRKALGSHTIALFAPQKSIFTSNLSEELLGNFDDIISDLGGYDFVVLGLLFHEAYHVRATDDQANMLVPFSDKLVITSGEAFKSIQQNEKLKKYVYAYALTVFEIGHLISVGKDVTQNLKELAAVIFEIKKESSATWRTVFVLEYAEGFATYVSAQSLIDIDEVSFDKQMSFIINDRSNNLTYRTGAIGGLYLNKELNLNPFVNNIEQSFGVWEIILKQHGITKGDESDLNNALNRVQTNDVKFQSEIKLLLDYL